MNNDDIPAMFNVASYPLAVDIDEQWQIAGYRYLTSAGELLDFAKREHVGNQLAPHDLALIDAADAERVS